MEKTIKIVLAAKLDGAQFLCCRCKKVFISEKHLKRHENRRHSVIQGSAVSMRPSERIKTLVEFLESKEPNGMPEKVERKVYKEERSLYLAKLPIQKTCGHGLMINTETQTCRSKVNSSTLEEAVQTDDLPIDSKFTQKSWARESQMRENKISGSKPVDTYKWEEGSLSSSSKNPCAMEEDFLDTPDDNGILMMSRIVFNDDVQLDIGDDDHARIIWKFGQLAEEVSFTETAAKVQLNDSTPTMISKSKPKVRSKLAEQSICSIYSVDNTNNDSWLIEDNSISPTLSESTANDRHVKHDDSGNTHSVGQHTKDITSPQGNAVIELQTHLLALGIDPQCKGVDQKIFEKARLALHSKRARIAQKTENFMSVLDKLKNSISDKVSEKLVIPDADQGKFN